MLQGRAPDSGCSGAETGAFSVGCGGLAETRVFSGGCGGLTETRAFTGSSEPFRLRTQACPWHGSGAGAMGMKPAC